MKKFYINEVPENTTVISWLRKNTDWQRLMETVKPKYDLPEVMTFKIDDFDPTVLAEDILDATTIYGDHGWKSTEGSAPGYTGFSLVYNPDQIDGLDPHSSTLGTPKNSTDAFFWNRTENHKILKNSYFDGYGFNVPTPASNHKSLGSFMERCKRTRVRSRMSIINGKFFNEATQDKRGWHKDEPVFENLRINIPITTNQHYFFELEGHKPVHLPVGHAYSWDTYVAHRVFNDGPDDSRRIHLVLGFSPWWDYLPDEQAWVQNEFYGNKHPFDMLVDGDILSGLHLDTDFSIY